MKAVRFRFVSIKNFRWIGICVFRTFTIPPICDFFPKNFDGNSDFDGSSYTALGVNAFLLNRIQLIKRRKISQGTLVEHVLLKHFQRLVVSPLVRWCVPDCHVR